MRGRLSGEAAQAHRPAGGGTGFQSLEQLRGVGGVQWAAEQEPLRLIAALILQGSSWLKFSTPSAITLCLSIAPSRSLRKRGAVVRIACVLTNERSILRRLTDKFAQPAEIGVPRAEIIDGDRDT